MNSAKIGGLIFALRHEQKLTQKALAEKLGVSDKAISKWERGMGCPDLSLWPMLSDIFGADMKNLLEGEISPCPPDQGNLRHLRFYRCPSCGNIMTSTSTAYISCCGRTLTALTCHAADSLHQAEITAIENEWYIHFLHAMDKTHYLVFLAYVVGHQVLLTRFYPEQTAEVRLPDLRGRGTLYFYCSQHGFWSQSMHPPHGR